MANKDKVSHFKTYVCRSVNLYHASARMSNKVKSRLATLKSKVSPLSIWYFCVKKANFLEQMFEKKIMAKMQLFYRKPLRKFWKKCNFSIRNSSGNPYEIFKKIGRKRLFPAQYSSVLSESFPLSIQGGSCLLHLPPPQSRQSGRGYKS